MTETKDVAMQHEPNTTTGQPGHTCGNGGEDDRPVVIRAGQIREESRPRVIQAGSRGENRHEAEVRGEASSPRVVRASGESAQAAAQTGANVKKSADAAKMADGPENRGGEGSDRRAVMRIADNWLRSGVVLSIGSQHAVIEWIGYSHRALERNLRALGKLMGCRTAKDVVDVQFDLFKSSVEDWLRRTNAVLRISAENTREATHGVTRRAAHSSKY